MPLLWFPRLRYRPGGPPSDPALREIWEDGRAAAGRSFSAAKEGPRFEQWSGRERSAFTAGLRAGTHEPTAPLRFDIAVIFLTADALLQASARDRIGPTICLLPVGLSIGGLRTEFERRRARELGLAAETAPQPRVDWEQTLLTLLASVCLRLAGIRVTNPTWQLTSARSVIGEIDRRRAWRHALEQSP
jgi:hypothetical protein